MSIDKIIRGLLSIPYFLLLWVVELGERSGRVSISGATPAGDPVPQGERHERRLKRLATLTDDELRADVEKHRQWIWIAAEPEAPYEDDEVKGPLVDEVLLRANSIRQAEEELARRALAMKTKPSRCTFTSPPRLGNRTSESWMICGAPTASKSVDYCEKHLLDEGK